MRHLIVEPVLSSILNTLNTSSCARLDGTATSSLNTVNLLEANRCVTSLGSQWQPINSAGTRRSWLGTSRSRNITSLSGEQDLGDSEEIENWSTSSIEEVLSENIETREVAVAVDCELCDFIEFTGNRILGPRRSIIKPCDGTDSYWSSTSGGAGVILSATTKSNISETATWWWELRSAYE